MNRIIIERGDPYYSMLCELSTPYDYPHNGKQYACADIDDESLCVLLLRRRCERAEGYLIDSMGLSRIPTYIVMKSKKSI